MVNENVDNWAREERERQARVRKELSGDRVSGGSCGGSDNRNNRREFDRNTGRYLTEEEARNLPQSYYDRNVYWRDPSRPA